MLQGRARCKFRAPYDACSVANIPRRVLGIPGVQIVERGRKIHEEKKLPPPPSVSRCTTYSLPTYHRTLLSDAWNRLDTCRIRVDGQIRFECGYVWTWTVLNTERKSCGFQNIRIRTVSRAILFTLVVEKVTPDSSSTNHPLYKYVQKK